MTAAIPQVLIDLGALLVLLGVFVGALQLKPVKWVFATLVGDPITLWLDSRNKAAVDPVLHLVKYHLGDNGGSPRLLDRVGSIEVQLRSVIGEQADVRSELRHDGVEASETKLVDRVEHIQEQVDSIADHQDPSGGTTDDAGTMA